MDSNNNSRQIKAVKFQDVTFGYIAGRDPILKNITLEMEVGKSYAFVGPTGQGKSTTASLIARLYSPTSGQIHFMGKDLEAYSSAELYQKIGFILQEPFLFEGTLLSNLIYGNSKFSQMALELEKDETEASTDKPSNKKGNSPQKGVAERSEDGALSKTDDQTTSTQPSKAYVKAQEEITKVLLEKNLDSLIDLFPDGLLTKVSNNSENISLGQKQIVNFLRVILREPEFLILDEATANLDTVTEKTLQNIIESLPKTTTKMIIAHRLNTIKDVDQIFLVGGGHIELG